MNSKVEEIYSKINGLSSDERKELMFMLTAMGDKVVSLTSFITENKFSDGVVCPYCGHKHIVRNGRRADGTQKYFCKDCHKSFVASTNTIAAQTHKPLEVWEKYISCMTQGMSLRESAIACEINLGTAFVWRHKILDALTNMCEDVRLGGITESDDTYFNVSYKGNHKKSKAFKMPRPSHHRGSDKISAGLSKDLACVQCAVDRNGHSIARVSNLGACSAKDIDAVLGSKIEKDTVFCTDASRAQHKFAKMHNLNCIQIKGGKRVVKGIYHIQHINSYHSMLKDFMREFSGVSTKYLNNYLVWHNFLNYAKNTIEEKKSVLMKFTLTTPKCITYKMITARPAMPVLNAA